MVTSPGRNWLLLVYTVPREPTAHRVAVWRKLGHIGEAWATETREGMQLSPEAEAWLNAQAQARIPYSRFPLVSSPIRFYRGESFRAESEFWLEWSQCWLEGGSPLPLPLPSQLAVDGVRADFPSPVESERPHVSWEIPRRRGLRRTEVVLQGPTGFGEFLTWSFVTPDDTLDLPAGALPPDRYTVRLRIHDVDPGDARIESIAEVTTAHW